MAGFCGILASEPKASRHKIRPLGRLEPSTQVLWSARPLTSLVGTGHMTPIPDGFGVWVYPLSEQASCARASGAKATVWTARARAAAGRPLARILFPSRRRAHIIPGSRRRTNAIPNMPGGQQRCLTQTALRRHKRIGGRCGRQFGGVMALRGLFWSKRMCGEIIHPSSNFPKFFHIKGEFHTKKGHF